MQVFFITPQMNSDVSRVFAAAKIFSVARCATKVNDDKASAWSVARRCGCLCRKVLNQKTPPTESRGSPTQEARLAVWETRGNYRQITRRLRCDAFTQTSWPICAGSTAQDPPVWWECRNDNRWEGWTSKYDRWNKHKEENKNQVLAEKQWIWREPSRLGGDRKRSAESKGEAYRVLQSWIQLLRERCPQHPSAPIATSRAGLLVSVARRRKFWCHGALKQLILFSFSHQLI